MLSPNPLAQLPSSLGGVVMCYVHLCVCRFLMDVCEKCAGHSLSYVQVP